MKKSCSKNCEVVNGSHDFRCPVMTWSENHTNSVGVHETFPKHFLKLNKSLLIKTMVSSGNFRFRLHLL